MLCRQPDATPRVLYVLLDPPLLPAAGDIAEIGIKEIVRAHRCKACVDGARLAAPDFVHGRSHVVVDAASGDTSECREAWGSDHTADKSAIWFVAERTTTFLLRYSAPLRPLRPQLRVQHVFLVARSHSHNASGRC